ncbi:MAG TPA: hypothetical protein VLT58_13190, partial [Polyangia bacterium]|nr:hypothetical protein [Polyangia bacterium]
GFPGFLSFFIPGLGQIVKGQLLVGVIIMGASALFGMLCFIGIGIPMLGILWIVQLYDAYAQPDAALNREADRIKARHAASGR